MGRWDGEWVDNQMDWRLDGWIGRRIDDHDTWIIEWIMDE